MADPVHLVTGLTAESHNIYTEGVRTGVIDCNCEVTEILHHTLVSNLTAAVYSLVVPLALSPASQQRVS